MGYYYTSIATSIRGGYLRFFSQYIEELPIQDNDRSKNGLPEKIEKLVTKILNLNSDLAICRITIEKDMNIRQIDATDREIDKLVYQLYDLTEDEIKIIEESVS